MDVAYLSINPEQEKECFPLSLLNKKNYRTQKSPLSCTALRLP